MKKSDDKNNVKRFTRKHSYCILDFNSDIYLARKHKDFSHELIKSVLKQDKAKVMACATPEAKKLYRMAKEVGREIHLTESFLRFNVNSKGILYAKVNVEHNVEKSIVKFFVNRYPLYVIVLESKRGCFIGYYDIDKDEKNKINRDVRKCKVIVEHCKSKMDEVVKQLENIRNNDDVLNEINEFDTRIWYEFYSKQGIRKRRNKKLFNRNMPKKHMEFNPELYKAELNDGNMTIDDFY